MLVARPGATRALARRPPAASSVLPAPARVGAPYSLVARPYSRRPELESLLVTAMKSPSAASIPVAAVALAFVAISGCYIVARAHGHVPAGLKDLPDITHCAMQQPERAVFLGFFMPACMLMVLSWLLAVVAFEARAGPGHSGVRTVKTAGVVGVLACGLIIMGESVLDAEPNWTVHVIGDLRHAVSAR